MANFSWEAVADVVEESLGFDFKEYEDYVEFDCVGVPYFEEIDKDEINSWDDLISYFKCALEDFDLDEFCLMGIEAKKNGMRGVPNIKGLVDDGEYIIESLRDLLAGWHTAAVNP